MGSGARNDVVLPGISGQVIEGTILDPSIPPRSTFNIQYSIFKRVPPPPKRWGGRGRKLGGLGSVCSVDSVAIHSGRGVCRDGLRLSRWRGLLPDGSGLPGKCRMNLFIVLDHGAAPVRLTSGPKAPKLRSRFILRAILRAQTGAESSHSTLLFSCRSSGPGYSFGLD